MCVCVCVCVHVLCAALAEKARDNYKCVRAQLFSVCSQLLPDHSYHRKYNKCQDYQKPD